MAPRHLFSNLSSVPALLSCHLRWGSSLSAKAVLTNLSLMGCSVMCDREVLCGSDVRVSVLLPKSEAGAVN